MALIPLPSHMALHFLRKLPIDTTKQKHSVAKRDEGRNIYTTCRVSPHQPVLLVTLVVTRDTVAISQCVDRLATTRPRKPPTPNLSDEGSSGLGSSRPRAGGDAQDIGIRKGSVRYFLMAAGVRSVSLFLGRHEARLSSGRERVAGKRGRRRWNRRGGRLSA